MTDLELVVHMSYMDNTYRNVEELFRSCVEYKRIYRLPYLNMVSFKPVTDVLKTDINGYVYQVPY